MHSANEVSESGVVVVVYLGQLKKKKKKPNADVVQLQKLISCVMFY